MKKLELALLLGLAASICCSSLAKAADSRAKLEDNVLRLHILANSDSIDDQVLKLKVRNRVLEYTGKLLKNPGDTLEQAEQIITEHLEELEDLAEAVVTEEGYAYPVSARLTEMPFEDRVYGNLTMPAGTYDALRITIGAAEGQNWWCVMYPALCVPSATEVKADGETAEQSFDDGEQELLEHPERYTVKLKCVEWLEKWFR
ncbi:stage II sporulation protein R [Ruminococcus sp.]|jgi:stage II sporulation protein R|nr:stage II sporulation protein R [Ruminococcus sp.]MEE0022472.1 stage II sporulation protein R [Ruminococcus sp.]